MTTIRNLLTALWTRLRAVQWNRHTFALLLGAAVAFVPDLTDLAKEATETGWRPLLIVARAIGWALTAIAVVSKAYVRISPVLDRIEAIAGEPQPGALPGTVQPGGPTPVTIENPTGGQKGTL